MKYWIWLSTLPYIGTVSARKIITVLKNPKNVYYSSEEELRKIGNLTLRQRNSILMNRELENAKRIIEQCEKHRISLLPIENPLYPKRAGNCNDAPIILYYKGTIQRMDKLLELWAQDDVHRKPRGLWQNWRWRIQKNRLQLSVGWPRELIPMHIRPV